MREEAVIILGASSLQIPLINYVKSRGYFVIVVSIPGDYPGFSLADKVVFMDVRNAEGIYEATKEYNIVSVLTDETDIAVPTVALLAKRFGLTGNDPDIASVYSNKFLMRKVCQKIGVSIPNYFRISSTLDLEEVKHSIIYPSMMKPEDSQGSRGIFKVYSIDDINKNFDESVSFSKTGNVIIEDFFTGQEVVCEGFVLKGEYINWGFADRNYFDIKDVFIPSQTIFPSNIPNDIKEQILEAEKRIHCELHPDYGMIHSEYLYDKETKKYILVETSLRGGGVYISSHLVPFFTGYDNYDLLLSCSLGNYPSIKAVQSQLRSLSAAYMCFYLPEGEICKIDGVEELKKRKAIKLIDVDGLDVGVRTSKMYNKTQRLGPIIIATDNRNELEKEMEIVKNTLVIQTRTANGQIVGMCWE